MNHYYQRWPMSIYFPVLVQTCRDSRCNEIDYNFVSSALCMRSTDTLTTFSMMCFSSWWSALPHVDAHHYERFEMWNHFWKYSQSMRCMLIQSNAIPFQFVSLTWIETDSKKPHGTFFHNFIHIHESIHFQRKKVIFHEPKLEDVQFNTLWLIWSAYTWLNVLQILFNSNESTSVPLLFPFSSTFNFQKASKTIKEQFVPCWKINANEFHLMVQLETHTMTCYFIDFIQCNCCLKHQLDPIW